MASEFERQKQFRKQPTRKIVRHAMENYRDPSVSNKVFEKMGRTVTGGVTERGLPVNLEKFADFWWGIPSDPPLEIATEMGKDALVVGTGIKLVNKVGKPLAKGAWNSKVVQDLIKASNEQGDKIVKMVQSKAQRLGLLPQTVPDATVTITKKTKKTTPVKKKTKTPKPQRNKGKQSKRIQPTPTGKKGRERRMYN